MEDDPENPQIVQTVRGIGYKFVTPEQLTCALRSASNACCATDALKLRRSLQARTVALTVILTLAVAIVFSGVSMVSVRASLLTQITSQSRADYSNMVQQAQTSLDAADVSATVQIQQLVNDLASSLQSEGPSNLIGVYLWSRDTNSCAIIPVSTEPSYQSLISDDIRSSVASDLDDSVFYQPVEIPGDSGMSGADCSGARHRIGLWRGRQPRILRHFIRTRSSNSP